MMTRKCGLPRTSCLQLARLAIIAGFVLIFLSVNVRAYDASDYQVCLVIAGEDGIVSAQEIEWATRLWETQTPVPGTDQLVVTSSALLEISRLYSDGVAVTEPSYKIPDTTVVMDDVLLNDVISMTDDFATITLRATTDTSDIDVGDVLVSGVSDWAPYGFIRRVTQVNLVGREIVLLTVRAYLPDAIEEGSFQYSGTPSISRVESLVSGTAIAPKTNLQLGEIKIALSNVELWDGGTPSNPDDGLHVSANGLVKMSLDVGMKWGLWDGLKEVWFTPTFDFGLDLKATLSAVKKWSREREVQRIYYAPITIMVGPVPVVITPVATAAIGAEVTVGAGLEAGVNITGARLAIGLMYTSADGFGLDPRSGFNADSVQKTAYLTPYGELEARVPYYKLRYKLLLGGLAGGQVSSTWYVGANAKATLVPPNLHWEVGFGHEAALGASFDLWGFGNNLEVEHTGMLPFFYKIAQGDIRTQGEITGTVLDASTALPLDGARIRVFSLSGGTLWTESETDGDGKYTCAVAPGSYSVEFFKAGYETLTRTSISVVAGGSTTLDASLVTSAEQGTLQGVVRSAETSSPLGGVSVVVKLGSSQVANGTTGSDGTFSLTVPASSSDYDVYFSLPLYVPETYSAVSIKSGETTTLEPILQVQQIHAGDGTVGGTIRDAVSGAGIDGIALQFRRGVNVLDGGIVAQTSTGTDGTYSMANLPGGSYTVTASGPGYVTGAFTVVSIGGESKLAQDASLSPQLNPGEWRIVLSWGENPRDLDSHLGFVTEETETVEHVYYLHKTAGGVSLDLDDTDSYGPETITIAALGDAVYRYSVKRFTGTGTLAGSSAQVRVIGEGGQIIEIYNVPPTGVGDWWVVFEIRDGAVVPINEFSEASTSWRPE